MGEGVQPVQPQCLKKLKLQFCNPKNLQDPKQKKNIVIATTLFKVYSCKDNGLTYSLKYTDNQHPHIYCLLSKCLGKKKLNILAHFPKPSFWPLFLFSWLAPQYSERFKLKPQKHVCYQVYFNSTHSQKGQRKWKYALKTDQYIPMIIFHQ